MNALHAMFPLANSRSFQDRCVSRLPHVQEPRIVYDGCSRLEYLQGNSPVKQYDDDDDVIVFQASPPMISPPF